MGNYISCLPQKPKTAKIVDAQGNLQRVQTPIKAAEIMLQSPGHVICLSDELTRTCRVLPLKADDDLRAAKLYLLFPITRINSRVKDEEMSMIESKKKTKTKAGARRVFPDAVRVRVRVCLEGEDGERDTGFPGHRLGNYQQWMPVLETIQEGL